MLLFCALLPAIVLAGYGIKGLLEAEQVYEAGLRRDRELQSTTLHRDLIEQTEHSLTTLVAAGKDICKEEDWRDSPEPCARSWLNREVRARELVVLSGTGKVVFPSYREREGLEPSALLFLGQNLTARPEDDSGMRRLHLDSDSLKLIAVEVALGGQRVLIRIDQKLLRDELTPLLNRFNRGNPGLSASIVDSAAASTDFEANADQNSISRVVFGPWLPSYSVQLRTLSAARNPASGLSLWL